jgi:arginyl-tRNA synthetase
MQIEELSGAIKDAARKLFGTEIEPELSRPDEKFGDYATNAALQLAKKTAKTPSQIAKQLIAELEGIPKVKEITSAGPGFINFRLTDEAIGQAALSATDLPKPNAGQEILAEFGDPNPFKEMHIGHLYSYIVGDAISGLLETAGATVRRLSYHGDVGPHVAKAIYGINIMEKERQAGDKPSADVPTIEREEFLAVAYANGAKAYENDPEAKAEIDKINEHIYKKDDPEINQLHLKGSQLSFTYFDEILNLLSISTDKRYLESQSAEKGSELVRQNVGKVFKESQGAIIYEGEKAGLHTRVFITSRGLPTYEAKDLGLAELKAQDYPDAGRSISVFELRQNEQPRR